MNTIIRKPETTSRVTRVSRFSQLLWLAMGWSEDEKKQSYLLIGLTSFLFFFWLIVYLIFWTRLVLFATGISRKQKLIFLILVFSLSMTFFFFVLFLARDRRSLSQKNAGQSQATTSRKRGGCFLQIQTWMPVSNPCLASSTLLTEAVQKAENQGLVKEETIIEERTEADSTWPARYS